MQEYMKVYKDMEYEVAICRNKFQYKLRDHP
jgi:hypothetical protein